MLALALRHARPGCKLGSPPRPFRCAVARPLTSACRMASLISALPNHRTPPLYTCSERVATPPASCGRAAGGDRTGHEEGRPRVRAC